MFLVFAALPAVAEKAEEFTARRDFSGLVRRDMAELAARLAAEIEAMDQAARLLAKNPDLRFAVGPATTDTQPPQAEEQGNFASVDLSLDGLAKLVFKTRVTGLGMEGFPPSVQATARVRLEPPVDMRKALQEALKRPDLIEINGQVLASQRALLARYDSLAVKLLPLRPSRDGGMEDQHALRNVINEMKALDMFLPLLPSYEQHWRTPEKAGAELAKAAKLAPGNPLVLTAMAEALLQLDRPVPALERVGEALNSAPGYARAHDVKGAILLRQRLPSLAAEAFSRAIALAPRNSSYLVHRASAYLVLENAPAMCADFTAACVLGDCEGLQWAKESGKCVP